MELILVSPVVDQRSHVPLFIPNSDLFQSLINKTKFSCLDRNETIQNIALPKVFLQLLAVGACWRLIEQSYIWEGVAAYGLLGLSNTHVEIFYKKKRIIEL